MASPAEPITQRSNHPAEAVTHADRFILQSKAEVMNSPIRHIDSIVNWMAGTGLVLRRRRSLRSRYGRAGGVADGEAGCHGAEGEARSECVRTSKSDAY